MAAPLAWTARDLALIQRYYDPADSATITALVAVTGKLRHQIVHQAGKLGLRRKGPLPWTPADETTLQLLWGRVPDAVVATRLRRTITACELKMKRMNWSRSKGVQGWTGRELGRLFGVDEHKVTLQWVARGWLHGTRLPYFVGPNHPYLFKEPDVVRFIRRYPHEYDWQRMKDPSGYYQRVARQMWEVDPLLTTAQVAQRANLTVTCICRWTASGRIPAIKGHTNGNAGVWWYRTSDLPTILATLPRGGWKKQRKAA